MPEREGKIVSKVLRESSRGVVLSQLVKRGLMVPRGQELENTGKEDSCARAARGRLRA